jgi:hypothetical protein
VVEAEAPIPAARAPWAAVIDILNSSVADPVGSGPFWPDPDLDVWDRIRILTINNEKLFGV